MQLNWPGKKEAGGVRTEVCYQIPFTNSVHLGTQQHTLPEINPCISLYPSSSSTSVTKSIMALLVLTHGGETVKQLVSTDGSITSTK